MSKIVIIEDDASFATLMETVLKNNGFEVAIANDGLTGIQLTHTENPDLIILDLIMPLGGGLAALRNFKVSTHTDLIPIIVVSGTSDDHLIEQVKSMGVNAFFRKPFDINDLISKINELLAK